jgi:two-component system sensor histidine kinase RpfC
MERLRALRWQPGQPGPKLPESVYRRIVIWVAILGLLPAAAALVSGHSERNWLMVAGGSVAVAIAVLFWVLAKIMRALSAAERENRNKTEFLSKSSHELRTPLQAIIGMADLLTTTDLTETQKHYARTISSTGRNLAQLINEILDVTRIEAGKLPIEPVDFDLHGLIKNLCSTFEVEATRKNLRFFTHVDPAAPYLLIGDEMRLQQILLNLVGNALKFTEKGHIEMRVDRQRDDGNTTWFSFSVADTGPGIPKSAQAAVFQRYEQADNTITRKYGGTGLGLTIAKELVQAMGGDDLSLSSEPGIGSTFSFSLPFRRQQNAEAPELQKGEALLFSREENVQEQLSDWLGGWGLTVTISETPPNILAESFGHGKPSIIFVDERSLADVQSFAQAVGRLDPVIRRTVILLRRRSLPPTEGLLRAGVAMSLSFPLDKREVFNAIHAVQADGPVPDGVAPITRFGEPAPSRTSLSVLLADDTAVNRDLIQEVLRRAGHRVYAVSNGADAIEALSANDFDIAICDLHMPEYSGVEVIQAYRAIDAFGASMPFIILTADATHAAREMCKDVGVEQLLTKPIRPRDLIAAVNKVISKSGRTSQSGPRAVDNPVPGLETVWSGSVGKTVAEPQPDTATPQLVDEVYLKGTGLRPAFLQQQIELFETDTRTKLDTLFALHKLGKYDAIRDILHSLKGNAGSLGAPALASFCAEIEQMPISGLKSARGMENLERLQNLYRRTCEALRTSRAGTGD